MNFIFKSKIIAIFLISALFVGCGYKESTTQIRDTGYLKFNKSKHETYKVVVNDHYQFSLKACNVDKNTGHCDDDTVNKVYKVSSGNINVKVYDNNMKILFERELYLGSNNTVEVDL